MISRRVSGSFNKAELKCVLAAYDGELRRLFNTSGVDYRQMKMKDRLPEMTNAEVIQLLSENGNLVKRPFIVDSSGGLLGFKLPEWENFFT